MILEARTTRNGRAYAAPRDVWIAAIDSILASRDRLVLPLKSHGYRLEIIVGQVHKAEQTAEAKREAGRGGHTPVGGHAPAPMPPAPTSEAPEKPRASRETIAKTLAAAKAITKGNA